MHINNRRFLFNTILQSLVSLEYFKAIVSNDINILFIISKKSVNIDLKNLRST